MLSAEYCVDKEYRKELLLYLDLIAKSAIKEGKECVQEINEAEKRVEEAKFNLKAAERKYGDLDDELSALTADVISEIELRKRILNSIDVKDRFDSMKAYIKSKYENNCS